jgi:hypothetical protein
MQVNNNEQIIKNRDCCTFMTQHISRDVCVVVFAVVHSESCARTCAYPGRLLRHSPAFGGMIP